MRRLLKQTIWRILYFLRRTLDISTFQEVAILCYHSIGNSDFYTSIKPGTLEAHILLLQKQGYRFVSLAEIVGWIRGTNTLPFKAIAFTFDDGYADFTTAALPLLSKHRVPATVFVVGDTAKSARELGSDSPLLSQESVALLRKQPFIEIGYHSRTHANLSRLSAEQLEEEIEPPSGERFFAYPGGNHSKAAADALRKRYQAACTIRPALVHRDSDPYLIPRIVITSEMSSLEVAARVGKAADWYWYIKNLFT